MAVHNRDVKPGLLLSILKTAGISRDELRELLEESWAVSGPRRRLRLRMSAENTAALARAVPQGHPEMTSTRGAVSLWRELGVVQTTRSACRRRRSQRESYPSAGSRVKLPPPSGATARKCRSSNVSSRAVS